MINKYEDILYVPHPVSKTHRPMNQLNRAAQFAPFAALTGFGETIQETSRRTESQVFLSEDQAYVINQHLDFFKQNPHVQAKIVYFVPDKRKQGGSYLTVISKIKKIDETFHRLTLTDGSVISIQSIISINSI